MVPGHLGAGQERCQLGAVWALSPTRERVAALLALLILVSLVISVRERTPCGCHASCGWPCSLRVAMLLAGTLSGGQVTMKPPVLHYATAVSLTSMGPSMGVVSTGMRSMRRSIAASRG